MATGHAHLEVSKDEAVARLVRVSAEQGWSLDGARSGPDHVVFTKGVSAFSNGSSITVLLGSRPDGVTTLVLTSAETFALTDWGRGRRAIDRLLEGIGAEQD